jgi:hypothetical protein
MPQSNRKNHNTELVNNLFEDNYKVDKKYISLLSDVKKWMVSTEQNVEAKHGKVEGDS